MTDRNAPPTSPAGEMEEVLVKYLEQNRRREEAYRGMRGQHHGGCQHHASAPSSPSKFWTFPPRAEEAALPPLPDSPPAASPSRQRKTPQHPLGAVEVHTFVSAAAASVDDSPPSPHSSTSSSSERDATTLSSTQTPPMTAATLAAIAQQAQSQSQPLGQQQPSHSKHCRHATRGVWVSDASTQTTVDVGTQTRAAQRAASPTDAAAAVATAAATATGIPLRAPKSPTVRHFLEGQSHKRSTSDTSQGQPIVMSPRIGSSPKHPSSTQLAAIADGPLGGSHATHSRSHSDTSPKRAASCSTGRSPLAPATASPSPSATVMSPRIAPLVPRINVAAAVTTLPPSPYWNGSASLQSSLDDIEEEIFRITQRARDISRELSSARRCGSSGSSSSPGMAPSPAIVRPPGRASVYAPGPIQMMFGHFADREFADEEAADDEAEEEEDEEEEDDDFDEFENLQPLSIEPVSRRIGAPRDDLTSPDQGKYVPIRGLHSAFRSSSGSSSTETGF